MDDASTSDIEDNSDKKVESLVCFIALPNESSPKLGNKWEFWLW